MPHTIAEVRPFVNGNSGMKGIRSRAGKPVRHAPKVQQLNAGCSSHTPRRAHAGAAIQHGFYLRIDPDCGMMRVRAES
jgi:hypothetical protein